MKLFVFAVLLAAISVAAADFTVTRDITYARVDDHDLTLDLYLPAVQPKSALIVWVHGGAWREGSKKDMPLTQLVRDGWAIASVDYRLSTVAKFPAQIHDLKATIRFLRGHTRSLQIAADKIVIAGNSAGGHLAALVGVTNDDPQLEGTVGEDLKQPSAVQGIMSFYGASDLTTILDQSTPHGLKVRVPALDLLLGGQPQEKSELARLASPVFHVDANDPPLLLVHGDQDPQMPINQAHELFGAYRKAGRPAQFEVVYGAGHGGPQFFDPERLVIIRHFLASIP